MTQTTVHIVLGVALIVSSAAAGGWGAWRFYRVEPSQLFWRLLRVSQGAAALVALDGALLLALGREAPSLHLLYGFLPLAVSFIGEQLRIASAETVLAARDLPDAAAVGTLTEEEQRSVVLAIVRREMGVMTAAALVVVVLGLRAAGWL
ncbi:MAG TPA: hypothetical protein VF533_00305 [Solirubrobacteraceae bacterium]